MGGKVLGVGWGEISLDFLLLSLVNSHSIFYFNCPLEIVKVDFVDNVSRYPNDYRGHTHPILKLDKEAKPSVTEPYIATSL